SWRSPRCVMSSRRAASILASAPCRLSGVWSPWSSRNLEPRPEGIKEPQPLALKVAPGLTSLCDRGTTPRDDRLLGRHRYQNLPAPPSAGPIFLTQRVRLLWRRRARYSGFVAAS